MYLSEIWYSLIFDNNPEIEEDVLVEGSCPGSIKQATIKLRHTTTLIKGPRMSDIPYFYIQFGMDILLSSLIQNYPYSVLYFLWLRVIILPHYLQTQLTLIDDQTV